MILPILNAELQSQAEKNYKAQNVSEFEMMENLGQSMASRLDKVCAQLKPDAVYFLIGRGNNGGDGLSVARYSTTKTKFIFCLDRENPSSLNEKEFELLKASKKKNELIYLDFSKNDFKEIKKYKNSGKKVVIVDALLGVGAKDRAPETSTIKLLNFIKEAHFARSYVIAVDVPSGLLENAKRIHEFKFLRAHETFSVASVKFSQLHDDGVAASGRLKVFSLGKDVSELLTRQKYSYIPSVRDALELLTKEHSVKLYQASSDQHKNSRGRVLLVGGELHHGGALRLAAEAAMRSGAGYATVLQEDKDKYSISELQEWTLKSFSEIQNYENFFDDYSSIVFGCGLNPNVTLNWNPNFWKALSRYKGLLVVDAGGLIPFLKEISHCEADLIFTPHPGEAHRILEALGEKYPETRFEVFEKLKSLLVSKKYKGALLLKGAYPIVSDLNEDSRQWIFNLADSKLASAGSGDVLAGFLGGLNRQMEVQSQKALSILMMGLCSQKIALKKLTQSSLARDILKAMCEAREKLWQN